MTGHVARAEVIVDATPRRSGARSPTRSRCGRGWWAPTLTTDWQVGSPITWQGEMNGKPYEDKGEVLEVDEPHRLSMTHYSPLMGQEDKPENYHTVTYTLTPTRDGRTTVTLEQDGNESAGAGRAVLAELAGDARVAEVGRRVGLTRRPASSPAPQAESAPTRAGRRRSAVTSVGSAEARLERDRDGLEGLAHGAVRLGVLGSGLEVLGRHAGRPRRRRSARSR